MRLVLCAILASITFFAVGCHHNTRRNNGCCGCGSCGQTMHQNAGGHVRGGHFGGGQDRGGHDRGGHFGGGQNHGERLGRPSHVARLPHGYMQEQMQGGGPQGPTVAYPYYTTRAPRDFLMANPPGIGP